MVRWSLDSTHLLTLPVYLPSVSSRNRVKMEVIIIIIIIIIIHENSYLEEVRILSWNMELVTVQEVGKELWVFIIVKVFVLWNIHHIHVSCHEKLTFMRRQSDVKIEHFLFISLFRFSKQNIM